MKTFTFITLAVILSSSLIAQNYEIKPEYKTSFSIVPHYLFFKGLKGDLEFRIKENQNIVVSGQFYLHEREDIDNDKIGNDNYYTYLEGYGGGLDHRIILKGNRHSRLIFSYGASYNYFNIKYPLLSWYTVHENGFDYVKYGMNEQKKEINRINFHVSFSVQIIIGERIIFEPYLGTGLKKTLKNDENDPSKDLFNDNMWSYGYTGTAVYFGAKLGIFL